MRIHQVWGIDQTGASKGKLGVKALPAALLRKTNSGLWLEHNIDLPQLTPQHLSQNGWSQKKPSILFVDSVLGLPHEVQTSFSTDLLIEASKFLEKNRRYGAQTAHSFFTKLLSQEQKKNIPTRTAEVKAKANSIFKLQPYQRNIGCGTFRVWTDLGSAPDWFHLWNQKEKGNRQHKIVEAYPSLLWIKRIQSKRGDENSLRKWLRANRIALNSDGFKSVDHMDAAVLAAAGYLHQSLLKEKIPLAAKLAKQEGWIFDLS